MKTYPDIDPETLGAHYEKHIVAMTVERLDSKADIATQLALRDQEIERLRDAIALIGTKSAVGDYYSDEGDDIYQTRRRAVATDAERLDWCQENLADVFQDMGEGFWIGYLDEDGRHQTSSRCPTLRQAIDAAMQKDTQ